MSRPIPPSYKTKNWPAYNEALKQRGSLTIWFDPNMVWVPPPTGKRGRPLQYSDAAIQTCLTMKVLFGMALRQTSRFVESLLRLVGLDWVVPAPLPGTRPSAQRNTSAARSGENGAAITAEAAPRRRCTA